MMILQVFWVKPGTLCNVEFIVLITGTYRTPSLQGLFFKSCSKSFILDNNWTLLLHANRSIQLIAVFETQELEKTFGSIPVLSYISFY